MKLWDKQPDESDAAYSRFLTYRNLGPARSIESAFAIQTESKEIKRDQVSSQWRRDSVSYQWVERSQAWDIENLVVHGERIITAYLASLDNITRKTLAYLTDESNQPDNWESAVKTLELISKVVSGESAAELYRARSERRNNSD
jgi:hypothetical protein